MRYEKEIYQALKILLLFATLTSIFRLLQKLSPVLFVGSNRDGLMNFVEVNLVWFTVMLFMIASLCLYLRKSEGSFSLAFIHNPMIRLTSGLLILFEGLFNLSISIPVALFNIKTFHQSATAFENSFGTSQATLLKTNLIPSVINLLQVFVGLYMTLHVKQNKQPESLD